MKKLVIIVTLLFVALLSLLLFGFIMISRVSPHTVNKMIEKYSDDRNYVALSGEVIEYHDYEVSIVCEEIRTYIPYQSPICSYHIYSEEILDLNVGDVIDFVTVPEHFFDGQHLPIVEVKLNGNTLLNIYDGKNNLMTWVNTLK